MIVRQKRLLLVKARQALGWSQRQLGENVGSSHRTASRWETGRSDLDHISAARLVQHLHPVDRDLAAELAAAVGQSLISLGLEAPPAPAVAAPSEESRLTSLRDVLDCVVYSVADAADVAPKGVRQLVLLALRRSLELGLDLEAAGKAGLLVASAGPKPTTGTRAESGA